MFWLGLLVSLSNLLLGLIILFARRNSHASKTFGIFTVSMAIWLLSIFITIYLSADLFWGRLAIAASIQGAAFLLLFTLIFPEEKLPSWPVRILIMGPAVFFTIISFTDLMVSGLKVVDNSIVGEFGPLRKLYGLYPPIYIFSSVFILVKKYLKLEGVQKIKLKYSLWGIILALIPAVITNGVLPAFKIYTFNGVGPLFITFVVVFTSYAIFRHQFLDIKIIIQGGIVYTISSAFVLGSYLAVVFILGVIFQEITHITYFISGYITAIIGIFGAPLIEGYFKKLTDRIFFKDKYNYSLAVKELSEILNKNLDEDKIISKATQKLKDIFKVKDAAIRFNVYPPKLEEFSDSEQLLIPLTIDDKIVGSIFVGRKLSGDIYTREDANLLETFAYQAAVALSKAELYKKVFEYSQKLEEKVKDRTSKIQDLQEQERQIMMDITHGLQTPLAILKGELEFLKRKDILKEEETLVFDRSIDNISKLVYGLMNLVKLETSKEDFKKDNFSLSETVKELVEYFEVLARESNVELISEIENDIYILGDEARIKELITNLVSNAFKYMDEKRDKKIIVGLAKHDGLVELKIEDTGIGISEDNLKNIFNRFYRVNNQNKSMGFGLGLAISKKIVEKHNGSIEISSKLGEGTKFLVKFPLE
jgi:signal transduction histidine kinase